MLITLLITFPRRARVWRAFFWIFDYCKGSKLIFVQELRETACTTHGRTKLYAGFTQLPPGDEFRPCRYILASILGNYGVKGATFRAEFTLGRFLAFYAQTVQSVWWIDFITKLRNFITSEGVLTKLAKGEQYADVHILDLLPNNIGACRRRHKNYIQQNLRGLVSSSSGHFVYNHHELILLIHCLLGL